MEYLVWTLIALVAYSFVAPLASMVTREIPSAAALFLATAVFLAITSAVLALTGTADPSYAQTPAAGYVYVAGVFLTIGILAYVAALETGPVSVVVPIFGMFIVGSSAIAILALEEALTIERAAGIGCAILAIYLSVGEE